MTKTPNLKMEMLHANQAQKEVTMNENLVRIDAILNNGAMSKSLIDAPNSPKDGQLFVVAQGASKNGKNAKWPASEAGHLAYFSNLAWHFFEPKEGLILWVIDENQSFVFTKGKWTNLVKQNELTLENFSSCEMQLPKMQSEMKNEDGSSRMFLDKQGTEKFASHIFRNSFKGMAEFGLLGNDHFGLKVSDDGKNFKKSFEINNENAQVVFEEKVHFKNFALGLNKVKYVTNSKTNSHIEIDGKEANFFEISLQANATLKIMKYEEEMMKLQKITLILQTNGHELEILSELKGRTDTKIKEDSVLEVISADHGQTWYLK